jgi:membrane associated rhomboid family serine protease
MLTYRFKYANPILKLIYINAIVFAISLLVNLISFLFFKEKGIADLYLSLPSNIHLFAKQFWSVLTYQFAHHGVFHFIFNMLTLYFIGSIFLDFYNLIK